MADPINKRALGPNHRPGCDGMRWTHSGEGYNRVRVCVCGAEDHDPDTSKMKPFDIEKIVKEMDRRD